LWNLSQLDTSPQVFQHEGEVFAVTFCFSKDNPIQWLASGSTDCKVRLWDLRQPDTPPKVLIAHKDGVSSIAFSPDGQKLASGSWDNTIQLWDLCHLEASPITLNRHTKSVTSVTFSPDGKTLASCSDDCTIILWNLQNLDADPTVLRDHNGESRQLPLVPMDRNWLRPVMTGLSGYGT
jgi:WD40 repeat protein